MTKRLSPDQIDEAYDRIGATPRRNTYHESKDNSGCGIGVFAIACLGWETDCDTDRLKRNLVLHTLWRDAGYDNNYRRGFTWGFDGDELDPKKDQDVMSNELFMMGYPDGQAAWEKVKSRCGN